MSLSNKINSVQGIALAALQATANLSTYVSTCITPEIGGIPVANFNNTWSSLVNNTIPSLLPTARFNNTITSYLSKTEASSTYVSSLNFSTFTVNINTTLNNILNNSITVNSDINNIKATLPSLLSINNFNTTI